MTIRSKDECIARAGRALALAIREYNERMSDDEVAA